MAFSGSSYFAGIATAFVGTAFGFAVGSMVTTSVVRPPNRLERVSGGTLGLSNAASPRSSVAASNPGAQATTKSQTPDAQPAAVAAAPSAAAAGSKPEQQQHQPQSAAPVVARTDATPTRETTKDQPAPASAASAPAAAAPAPAAKSDDTAVVRNERANSHTAVSNKDFPRKKEGRKFSDDRKSSDRRHRQDQDGHRLDEASDVVRQIPRDNPAGEVVERDAPRLVRQRHFEAFDDDDDSPRVINEPPPRFGFFGD